MKRKNFFTSLLMGLGVLVGLGSCDSNNVPRDNQQTDVVNRSTIRSANIENGGETITLSSFYEDKSSEYYMALTPKDCKFEIFKNVRDIADSEDDEYLGDPGTYDNGGVDYIHGEDMGRYAWVTDNIFKYTPLSEVERTDKQGKEYSVNIKDTNYDDKFFMRLYGQESSDDYRPEYYPEITYYASIVCPKNKYKILGVTIDGKAYSTDKYVSKLDLDSFILKTYSPKLKYEKNHQTYKDKDIFCVSLSNSGKVSFLLGDKQTGKPIGMSYFFSAYFWEGSGKARILVNGKKELDLRYPSDGNGFYIPKGSKVELQGEPNEGYGEPYMLFAENNVNMDYFDSINLTPDKKRFTNFIYKGNQDINTLIIFPKKKYIDIVVTKPENGDIKCTVGDKVYVNESFKVEEGSNTPIKLEAIYNFDYYRFNGFSINQSPQNANPYNIYLNNYKGKSEISIKAVIDPAPAMKYGVSLSSVKGGVARLSEDGLLDQGTEVEVFSNPDEGYELDKILVNGRVIDGTSFKVNSNSKVQVLFKKVK